MVQYGLIHNEKLLSGKMFQGLKVYVLEIDQAIFGMSRVWVNNLT